MKTKLKIGLNALLVTLLVFMMPATVFASGNTNSKEEVIYGMLDDNGSVREAYVVNIFDEPGMIIDYGDYATVKNMTSKDEVKLNGEQVVVENTEETLYYEGLLTSNELPWDISIQYLLDEVEYSATELAGKSGALEIALNISENKNIYPFFFENYGVQATVILDTEKAKNIIAEEATMANVGKNKQLTYTILPGKGADITIQADVEDFEMEAISINGIHLNLGLDFDIEDADLMDKVEELLSGVDQLGQGTHALKSGAHQLKEGSTELDSGAKKLSEGTVDLDSGANALQNGIQEINQALEQLASQSDALTEGSAEFKAALIEVQSRLTEVAFEADRIQELNDASSEIKKGINELTESLALLNESVGYEQYKEQVKAQGLDLDDVEAGNQRILDTLNSLIQKIQEIAGKIQEVTGLDLLDEEIEELIQGLGGIEMLVEGNQAALGGTQIYLEEVSYSINQIYQGSAGLNESYRQFDAAISELVGSLSHLVGKLPELTDAIDLLVEKYGEFDTGVNHYTDGVAQILVGHKEIVDGTASLNAGTLTLKSGSSMLHNNMDTLIQGTVDLYTGTEKLADGTREFKDKADNLDEEVQAEIDATLSEIMGDANETISFVSDKNENVESVQFVLKTNAIEMNGEIEEVVEEEARDVTFWDKFKELFRFNA